MPECEICGKQTASVFEINLEGAQMLVCESCARGKEVVHRFGSEEGGGGLREAEPERETEELIENYGREVRKAREAMGLPLAVLAERINEKESALARIEKERTLPSEKTRMKLERELGIRLLSRGAAERMFVPAKKGEPPTLGDLAKKKDEEEGE